MPEPETKKRTSSSSSCVCSWRNFARAAFAFAGNSGSSLGCRPRTSTVVKPSSAFSLSISGPYAANTVSLSASAGTSSRIGHCS